MYESSPVGDTSAILLVTHLISLAANTGTAKLMRLATRLMKASQIHSSCRESLEAVSCCLQARQYCSRPSHPKLPCSKLIRRTSCCAMATIIYDALHDGETVLEYVKNDGHMADIFEGPVASKVSRCMFQHPGIDCRVRSRLGTIFGR